ncbi:hypothetical protein ACFORO_10270 [Amycolatopsis halotolerans]|uniref:Uncharacterized protein n=1 Tax=Amycolatopsis halotolerans TaxID=330083 RepID=A0ABV7QCS6_9PSEU
MDLLETLFDADGAQVRRALVRQLGASAVAGGGTAGPRRAPSRERRMDAPALLYLDKSS